MKRDISSTHIFVTVAFFLTLSASSCTRRVKENLPPQTPAEAIASAEAIAKAVPSFDTWISLGLLYSNAGMSQKALEEFKRAATANPKSAVAHNNVCSEYIALKQLDLAIASCQEALTLDPTLQIAQNNLSRANLEKAGQAEQTAALEQAANSSDENVSTPARINLGLEYYRRGENERAIKIWEKIGVKNPHYAMAQNNIASAAIQLKQFAQARRALDHALKIEPQNPLFLNNEKWLATSMKAAE